MSLVLDEIGEAINPSRDVARGVGIDERVVEDVAIEIDIARVETNGIEGDEAPNTSIIDTIGSLKLVMGKFPMAIA